MIETKCQICNSPSPKYKCPACSILFCSVSCSKRHKMQSGCTGLKDPTAFIKRDEYTENSFNRDYNFLLNVGRKFTVGKRDMQEKYKGDLFRVKRRKTDNNNHNDNEVSRRGVIVRSLPRTMTRSINNHSRMVKATNCYQWTIELILIDDQGKNLKQVTFNDFETTKLFDIIKFIRKEFGWAVEEEAANREIFEIKRDEVIKNLRFFLLDIDSEANNKCLIEMNKDATIGTELTGKKVLEYPTIYALADYVGTIKNKIGKVLKVPGFTFASDSKNDSESNDDSSGESSDGDTASDKIEESNNESKKPPDQAREHEHVVATDEYKPICNDSDSDDAPIEEDFTKVSHII